MIPNAKNGSSSQTKTLEAMMSFMEKPGQLILLKSAKPSATTTRDVKASCGQLTKIQTNGLEDFVG